MAGYSLINFFFGSKWVTDTCVHLFQAYAFHILFCALNGISEAYMNAKGDPDTLKLMTKLMMVKSFSYLGMCYVFSVYPGHFGFMGLVYANALNMLIRGVTNLYLANQHAYQFEHGKKQSICANLFSTITWIVTQLFLGKNYLSLTGAGVALIFVANKFVMPLLFGTLWTG